MSTLGYVTGNLDREQKLLRELNNSLLIMEAEALGKAADLGFDAADVDDSRERLLVFGTKLLSALSQESADPDLQSLIHRIGSGMKPLDDWKEDLRNLVGQLQSSGRPSKGTLPALEEILSLLDEEFTTDLRRLYGR